MLAFHMTSSRLPFAPVFALLSALPSAAGCVGGSDAASPWPRADAGSDSIAAPDVKADRTADPDGPDAESADSAPPEASTPEASTPEASVPEASVPEAAACLAAMQTCTAADTCCDGRACGDTTAGHVCCGNEQAACATSDGSDCCGELWCVDGRCQRGEAMFKAPYPCGQSWTYDHHSAEVREALDFIRNDGETGGTPVLASAEGTASQHFEPGGAGNYIAIQHVGGWMTYYFHLSDFSVADGTHVMQGQQIGLTGSTGASSGPHIHYEQLLNGAGQVIQLNGQSLAPYPPEYGIASLVSDNGCGGPKSFQTWGNDRPVHAEASLSSPIVGTLAGPAQVTVICQKKGDSVTAEGYTNDWWSKLAAPAGFISNIYIDDPASKLPGVPDC